MIYDGEVYIHRTERGARNGGRGLRAPEAGARREVAGEPPRPEPRDAPALPQQIARLEATVARLEEQLARLSDLVEQVAVAGDLRGQAGGGTSAAADTDAVALAGAAPGGGAPGVKISFFAGDGTTAVVGNPRVIHP